MSRIWITVDVEAQPNRAPDDHVSRLIWGRFPEGEYGIGRMMDIADQGGAKLTMFTDLAEIDRYGVSFEEVARSIDQRGHDLQVHVHSEFFEPVVWSAKGTKQVVDLNTTNDLQADCIAEQLVSRYRRICAKEPLAFRGGGYRYNEHLLRSLAKYGIVLDSSVNRARKTQPFELPATRPFLWPNGLIEIPISVVDGFRNIKRPFDFNFNSAHFRTHKDMLEYVEHFESMYGQDAVVVLVMHSWSLLDISQGEFFGPPLIGHAKRLEHFIKAASRHHDFVTSEDIVDASERRVLGSDGVKDPRSFGDDFWSVAPVRRIVVADAGAQRTDTFQNLGATDGSSFLRDSLTRCPSYPLEEFGYPWHTSSDFKPAMEAMLAGRWEKAGYLVTDMKPPINFDGHSRPHACDLHSWEPAGYALRAYQVFGDERYLRLATNFIFDWLDRYWKPVSDRVDVNSLDALIADNSNFAWYDMAVGRRIFRLAYLLDVLARDASTSDKTIVSLWSAVQFHHRMLERDHFFRINSNHGIHQALGQLAAARRFFQMPESAPQYALARERLLQLLGEHFTSEGVHREHSPGYHYGLLTSIIGARASGLVVDRELDLRLAEMEKVLGWMIMPDGRIVPIGDTDPKPMNRTKAFVSQFSDKALQFQMSGGELGEAPKPGVLTLPESGFVFARLGNGETENIVGQHRDFAYMAQIVAFHSNTHKHADHLGFVWFDLGRSILTDAGRYAYAGKTHPRSDLARQGFWYSDPKRIYVEETRAHNCVEIDGRSYPRRSVEPFGSALRYGGEQHGLAVTDCELTHQRTVQHRRVLVMVPRRALLVLDWLNDRKHEHAYRQWFTFHPSWQVERRGDCLLAADAGDDTRAAAQLLMCNLIDGNVLADPVRGREEPDLLGWTSDAAYSLVPASSTCVEAPNAGRGRFATIFLLDGNAVVDTAASRFNETLRKGRVLWSDAQGKHQLSIELGAPGQVEVSLEEIA